MRPEVSGGGRGGDEQSRHDDEAYPEERTSCDCTDEDDCYSWDDH